MSIKFIPPLGRSPLATTVDPGGKVEVEEQRPYSIWNASLNFNGSGIQVKGCGCVTMPCYFLFLASGCMRRVPGNGPVVREEREKLNPSKVLWWIGKRERYK